MSNKRRIAALAVAVMALGPSVGMATDSGLTIEHPWARPAPAGQTSAIYLTVTDTGTPDQLIGARTPAAAEAQLHESRLNGTVMEMRPVQAAAVASGQPLVLAPGGYHIMLMGLKQPLKEGDTVPVTLMFQKAGAVTVQASVQRRPPTP